MPSQSKEVGILLGILPHIQEQNKPSYFLGKVNSNPAAAENQTRHLAGHQAATRT